MKLRRRREQVTGHQRDTGLESHPVEDERVDRLGHLDPEQVPAGRGRDPGSFGEPVDDLLTTKRKEVWSRALGVIPLVATQGRNPS